MNVFKIKPSIIIEDPNRVLTLANIISLLRGMSAIPIIYTLSRPDWNWLTGVLIILAALSDALDGYFARRANEVTHIGKWIDPLADFILTVAVMLYLSIANRFPFWYFLFYTIRHAMIAGLAIYFLNYNISILNSNWWGKWAASITALTVFLHIFEFSSLPWLKPVTVYVGAALLVISMIIYCKDFYSDFQKHHAT
ncbi:MAG: hypothetical protein CMG74_07235 [Candidatus Marinimicrobia bacterium]|nr:hypothetical protein [Candidatus Neomarinimicrobiota bacterium]